MALPLRDLFWDARLARLARMLAVAALMLFVSNATLVSAAYSAELPPPDPDLVRNEVELIHQTNLQRRAHGLPPLRWNREISLAARWLSYDSVANRESGYCDHADSSGRNARERQVAFGYINNANWGENIVCGFAPPTVAVDAWMGSSLHRENILNPAFREIGVGYYVDDEQGRGYVTQSFANDPNYAPLVIENEAPTTATPTVGLYIYAPAAQVGFNGMDAVDEMMIANDADFADAVWEPYQAEKRWTLASGEGWRTVYVRLRDGLGRIMTTSDTIYLGPELPVAELALTQASSVEKSVEFSSDSIVDWSGIQFRLNWIADDNDPAFAHRGIQSGHVTDGAALGGTAYRLNGADGEGTAVLRSARFHKNVPMEAYICLKISDNRSTDQVAEILIQGGGVTYGPLRLRGVDFAQADTYQHFLLPFTFHDDPLNPFLELIINKQGDADLYFDAATFFSAPQPTAETLTWHVPGDYYRGENVWARLKQEDGTFTRAFEIAAADIPQSVETPVSPRPQDDIQPLVPDATTEFVYLPLAQN